MKEKVCKYYKDEMCVNAECPMRADYCPVAQCPGICRYAELVDVVLSPKDCLLAILDDNGYGVKDSEADGVWCDFVELMAENGHAIVGVDALKAQNAKHEECCVALGDVVCIDDIEKSKFWKLKSFASNPFDTGCTYVTTDCMFAVRFEHQKKHGTVVLNQ